MPSRTNYSTYIPAALMIANVVIFVPMGFIVTDTLERIKNLENKQSKIQLQYITDTEYRDDLDTMQIRINLLEARLYDLSR